MNPRNSNVRDKYLHMETPCNGKSFIPQIAVKVDRILTQLVLVLCWLEWNGYFTWGEAPQLHNTGIDWGNVFKVRNILRRSKHAGVRSQEAVFFLIYSYEGAACNSHNCGVFIRNSKYDILHNKQRKTHWHSIWNRDGEWKHCCSLVCPI